jgi:hypothetical protein
VICLAAPGSSPVVDSREEIGIDRLAWKKVARRASTVMARHDLVVAAGILTI